MDHLFFLTDVGGPRLTASPGQRAAADWAIARLKSWGIANARSEPWGRFGRSWRLARFAAHQLTPTYAPLHGVPLAWSGGTRGAVTADAVLAPLFERFEDDAREDPARVAARVQDYVKRQRGKLAGRIVLIEPRRELRAGHGARHDSHGRRRARQARGGAGAGDAASARVADPPAARGPEAARAPSRDPAARSRRRPLDAADARPRPALVVPARGRRASRCSPTTPTGAARAASSSPRRPATGARARPSRRPWWCWRPRATAASPGCSSASSRCGSSSRSRSRCRTRTWRPRTWSPRSPGGKRADEVVMLGAHLDSWHAGTGATDNAAGCAVMLEAMRILKALDAPARPHACAWRCGAARSRASTARARYVKSHFGDPVTMRLQPEHAKLSGLLQRRQRHRQDPRRVPAGQRHGAADLRGLARAVRRPGRRARSRIRDTGGTDHLSFDAVGLPGFQFIQDPVDYGTRTHHSELDVYDHADGADLMQAAAIVASFVYHAANRPRCCRASRCRSRCRRGRTPQERASGPRRRPRAALPA